MNKRELAKDLAQDVMSWVAGKGECGVWLIAKNKGTIQKKHLCNLEGFGGISV